MNTDKITTDQEIENLAKDANVLASKCKRDVIWEDSPFSCIKGPISSSQVGKIGKELVKNWLTRNNFSFLPTNKGDREADIALNNKRVKIKFSILWGKKFYKFQQFRDQNYDLVICLGISPFSAHSWIFTKEFFMENKGKGEHFPPQHKGKDGIDTYWIKINPQAPANWLKDKGGSLSAAIEALHKLLPPS